MTEITENLNYNFHVDVRHPYTIQHRLFDAIGQKDNIEALRLISLMSPDEINLLRLSGKTLLMVAVEANNGDIINTLMYSYNADLYAQNFYKETVITMAAIAGNIEFLDKFLPMLANKFKDEILRAFIKAIEKRQINAAKFLLNYYEKNIGKFNIEARCGFNGETALIVASRNGDLDTIKYLISMRANPFVEYGDGNNAISSVLFGENDELAFKCLEFYASFFNILETKNFRGDNILIAAARRGFGLCVEFLLGLLVADKRLSYFLQKNIMGDNVLMVACSSCFSDYNLVKNLCEFADMNYMLDIIIDEPDCSNYTPLNLAAKCNKTDIVALLLSYNANANVVSANGDSPLYYAIKNNNMIMFRLLVELSDVNRKDMFGQTPLMVAVDAGIEYVKILLEKKANVRERNVRGFSALTIACVKKNEECVKLLIANGARVTDLEKGVRTSYAIDMILSYH